MEKQTAKRYRIYKGGDGWWHVENKDDPGDGCSYLTRAEAEDMAASLIIFDRLNQ